MSQLTQHSPPEPLQVTSQDGDLDIQKLLPHQHHQSTGLSHQLNQPDQVHSEVLTEILNHSLLLPQIIQFSQLIKPLELTLMDQFQDSENHTTSNKNQVSSQEILLPLSHRKSPDGPIHILSNKNQESSQEILLPLSHHKSLDGPTHMLSSKNQEFNQVI